MIAIAVRQMIMSFNVASLPVALGGMVKASAFRPQRLRPASWLMGCWSPWERPFTGALLVGLLSLVARAGIAASAKLTPELQAQVDLDNITSSAMTH